MMCFKDGEYIGIIIMILLERNIWSFLQTYIQDELNEDINQIQRDLFTNASSITSYKRSQSNKFKLTKYSDQIVLVGVKFNCKIENSVDPII